MASRTPRSDALAAWLARQRWFGSKARRIEGLAVEDRVPIGTGVLAVVAATLDDGAVDRYAVPLLPGDDVRDALDDPTYCRALLDLVAAAGQARGEAGEVRAARSAAFPSSMPASHAPRRLGGEQSNTSVAFGDALILKHFRRLVPGVNPEPEISRFLTERTSFRATPRLAGDLEYQGRNGEPAALGVVQELVPDAADGWSWMVSELEQFFGRARAHRGRPDAAAIERLGGATLGALRELGARTAELHLAFASDPDDPAFAPEIITPADVEGWAQGVRAQADAARGALGNRHALSSTPDVTAALTSLAGRRKIRHHGDFHLGQTLRRPGGQFLIIDFEGEPARPLAERRRKHAALRDVAGMLRSIDYAAASAQPAGDEWSALWVREVGAAFVDTYRRTAGPAPFLPLTEEGFSRAVAAFVLEKAAYEVVYEANNRPDWIQIPTRGLLRAAEALQAA
jgi:trehalose synthase-fused probable maltokinase